jgi:hypothetical protein
MKPKEALRLIEEQDFRCALSGRVLTPEVASLGHRVPLSRGGEHLLKNAAVYERRVSAAKGTMTEEEFVGMCREVTAWRQAAAGAGKTEPGAPS